MSDEMINETVDDLTITTEENGVEVVKEVDKKVLTKGAWATVMYLYKEFDAKTQDYGSIKVTIRRYNKKYGQYKQRSKFNITNMEQAKKIVDILQDWIESN